MPTEDQIYIPKNQAAFIVLISTAVMLVSFSIALYVPAMPAMVRDLDSTPTQLQLTLSVFMFGFGVAQLFWGPLSDRIGRKPTLVAGFSVYVAASLGAWLSHNIDMLIVFRFLQSVGACAVPVVSFAVVRDIYPRDQMARVMAYINAVRAVAPVVALYDGTAAQSR